MLIIIQSRLLRVRCHCCHGGALQRWSFQHLCYGSKTCMVKLTSSLIGNLNDWSCSEVHQHQQAYARRGTSLERRWYREKQVHSPPPRLIAGIITPPLPCLQRLLTSRVVYQR